MSPNSLDPHNVRGYRRRARLSRSLGAAAIPVAAAALIHPQTLEGGAIAVALTGPLDTIWTVGYLLGGICACAGVVWRPYPRPELEGLGVWLLAGAMLINALAIIVVRGPIAGSLTALGLIALADVLHARAQDLEDARKAASRHPVTIIPYRGPDRRRRPRQS